jgi:hypothetical protein
MDLQGKGERQGPVYVAAPLRVLSMLGEIPANAERLTRLARWRH